MSEAVYTSIPKNELFRGLVNSSTDPTYDTIVPTTDKPVTIDSTTTTANLIVIPCSGTEMQLFPFGGNDDNDGFTFRVYLWRRIYKSGSQTLDLWVPYLVGEFTAVLSVSMNGVAGSPLIATEMFADAVTEVGTTWDDNIVKVTTSVVSNINLGMARINTVGYELLQVVFDFDAGAVCDGANMCFASA